MAVVPIEPDRAATEVAAGAGPAEVSDDGPDTAPVVEPDVGSAARAGSARVGERTAEPVDGRDDGGNPEYRRAGLTAVVLLGALNVADVVLTQLLLRRDAVELNPVAGALLESNSALLVKLIIVCVLAADFLLRRPRLPTLCLLWLVTGFYVCVVIVNGTQLVAIWGP